MRIVIAPDSFKGSLSARTFCDIVGRTALRFYPAAQVQSVPIADGGEGTVEALVWATGGSCHRHRVTGPMGAPVEALYGILGDGETVVLEMAQASGLPLVPEGERDPRLATSYGTGELLHHVLQAGYRKVLLGIGGSATNDGGMGMLEALGVRFLDAQGQPLRGSGGALAQVCAVDLSGLEPMAADLRLDVICDVTNPLLGAQGATHVYGPQKGVTPALLEQLERGMENYAEKLEAAIGFPVREVPGAGAAGGMGAAVHGVLRGTLRPGIAAVLDAVGFDAMLAGADLVFTGEGRMDAQSIRYGKVPAGVAQRCAAREIPVIAIVGGMAPGAEGLYDITPSSIMTTVNGPMPLEQALQDAPALLESAAERVFRMLQIGQRLPEA